MKFILPFALFALSPTIFRTQHYSPLFVNCSNYIRKASTMSQNILERHNSIIKPSEDKREYLGLTLSNKLKVLLISDPETDISAASLSVHVGSMSDPWELQGLAHFLEHMLFMGTKKFPSENEYTKFLSQHGGSSNAYTSDTITNFYFDVAPIFFAESLDRFSQFFIEPLMLESSVSRELEAVNAEFFKNLDNDEWRLLQISKTIGDKTHDYYKFNIGNLETLRDVPNSTGINVRESLLKFYEKWYSANVMCLCVLGKEKIEDLANMVVPMFTPIANNNVTPTKWLVHPYSEQSLKKQIYVVPIKDKRSMKFIFPYPDEFKYYKQSPGQYLSHLIGHEGKGSLLSELKIRGLCSSLVSYFDCTDGFGFFYIGVDLTEAALNKTDEVATIVFQYIKLLKTEGPKQYIFDETKGLGYIKFNFMEKSNPIDYVQKLSTFMHYYPFEDVLSANILLDDFDPELIKQQLEYLDVDKCSTAIISKSFQGKTDLKETYYGTDYKVEDFSNDLLQKLKKIELNDNLKFPESNEFIPTNFDIIPNGANTSQVPVIIKNTEILKAWYLKDNIYMKPKVFYGIKILNPIVTISPHNVNANSMFIVLFKDALTEFLYDANLAGLSFEIYTAKYGINLEFYGYNHKMDVFLKRIFEKIINFKICPKRFEILREKYVRILKNYNTLPIYQLASYYLTLVTSELTWSYEDLMAALNSLTIESIQVLLKTIFSNLSIEAFFHGNISKDNALDICAVIEQFLQHYKATSLSNHPHSSLREIMLEPGSNYRYEVANDIQKPKAINMYFQVCFDNLQEVSKLLLIGQVLNEPFFDILRTKEQLGYIVFNKLSEMAGVHGFNFLIQSEYGTEYLDDRIEAFIVWAETYISEMNEEEFETEKNSLLTKLLKKKKRMVNLSKQYWTEIQKGEYDFKRNEQYAEVAKKFTKADILQFYKKYFLIDSPQRKKISIRIVKSDAALNDLKPTENITSLLPAPPAQESVLIKDYVEFKKHMPLYPLPKPKVNIYN